MDENIIKEGYRPIIQISLNKEGQKRVDIAPVAKDVIINLLADCLKIYAMKPDNVNKVPKVMTAGGLRNWINRKKRK